MCLISQGANVNTENDNEDSPLHIAVSFGIMTQIYVLRWSSNEIICICSGYFDIVKFLTENGADVNKSGEEDLTPLMRAAWKGDQTIQIKNFILVFPGKKSR